MLAAHRIQHLRKNLLGLRRTRFGIIVSGFCAAASRVSGFALANPDMKNVAASASSSTAAIFANFIRKAPNPIYIDDFAVMKFGQVGRQNRIGPAISSAVAALPSESRSAIFCPAFVSSTGFDMFRRHPGATEFTRMPCGAVPSRALCKSDDALLLRRNACEKIRPLSRCRADRIIFPDFCLIMCADAK